MKYLNITTNSLVSLVGRNDKERIDWPRIGTSPQIINLDGHNITQVVDGVTQYVIPVADETKALLFIEEECTPRGIVASVVTPEEAELLRTNTIE